LYYGVQYVSQLQTPPETGGVNMRSHVSTSRNPQIY